MGDISFNYNLKKPNAKIMCNLHTILEERAVALTAWSAMLVARLCEIKQL